MDAGRPDKLDHQIIRLLRQDGRRATKDIAQALGVTEATATSRIKALNEGGVMRVMAQLNVAMLRDRRLCLFNIWVRGRSAEAVADELATLSCLTTVQVCVGSPEIHVMAFVEENAHVLGLVQNEIGRVAGVDRLEVDLALAIQTYRSDYARLDAGPVGESGVGDTLDDRIVRQLQMDGRVSNREIARILEVPASTVRERVNRMLATRQIRIGAVCDPIRLGLSLGALANLRVTPSHLEAALSHLSGLEDAGMVASVSGAYNIFVVFGARDFEHLVGVVKNHLETTPGLRDLSVRNLAATRKHRADLINIVEP